PRPTRCRRTREGEPRAREAQPRRSAWSETPFRPIPGDRDGQSSVPAVPRYGAARLSAPGGTWRSLVARSVRDAEVAGSNPAVPTEHEISSPPHTGREGLRSKEFDASGGAR